MIDDRAIVAAGLLANGAGEPALADAGRADEGQIVVSVDPLALGEFLEQGAVEPARRAVVDVFDARLLTEPGGAQPRRQPFVAPQRGFPIKQQGEPVVAVDPLSLFCFREFGEGFRHAVEAKGVELIKSGMFEHVSVS